MKIAQYLAGHSCLVTCALCLGYSGALAQEYPAKSIRMIAPFAPGGSVDLIGRLVSSRLSESLGQQVVVDNRSGASGNIGTELVARAPGDGYTLLINTTPLAVNPHLFSKVPYDLVNDFVPIILVSQSPSIVTVHPSLPVHSIKQLLALAKARPGDLNYSTAGPGTNPHIAGELFNYLGKTNIVAIHYKGGGPGLVAAAGGEVVVTFTNIAESSAYVKSKRLRGLAVSSLKRSKSMPELPTVDEAGVPGYEFVAWHGILAPKGTPRAVAALLNDRIRKGLAAPDQVKRFEDMGLEIVAGTPEEFAAHLKNELAKWGPVIRQRGMRVE